MIAYIICFTLTPIFTYLAEKNFKNNNKKIGVAFSIVAVFIPTFICGIRRIGIGRDMDLYVEPVFKVALSRTFDSYIGTYMIRDIERGYAVFVYIVSKISSNIHLLFFLIQLFPCSAVYYFAYKNRERIPMWLVMMVYLLTWYCRSYTIMRQSIAIGFILIAILKTQEKKYIQTVLYFIIATLFHSSTLISIGLFIIIWINNTFEKNKKILIYFFVIIILCAVVISYQNILYFFTYKIELLPDKFYKYLNNNDYALEKTSIRTTETIFRIGCAIFGFIYLKIIKDEEEKNIFMQYFMFLVMEWIMYIISFKITNAIRIGYYYYYIGLLYVIPSLIKTVKRDAFNKGICCLAIIGYLGIFWFIRFPIKKDCETYPYKTDIITVLNKL